MSLARKSHINIQSDLYFIR